MKRAKKGLLLKLILAALFIYASVQIFELQVQIGQKKKVIEQYTAQNAALAVQNEALQSEIDKGLTDEQVEKIAGSKLNLIGPDETVFVGKNG
ncbi:MAG: hypothetical protein GXX99_04030 [Clostridiales bacterium]|nr:hypothetical protein [Clostridiales bacterium]